MTNETELAGPLHRAYCARTGLDLPLSLQRVFAWASWINQGWKLADLELVLAHKRKVCGQNQAKFLRACGFHWIVTDHDAFQEALSEARALARVCPHPHPDKKRVLEATGRSEQPTGQIKSAEQILKESALLRELLAKEGL